MACGVAFKALSYCPRCKGSRPEPVRKNVGLGLMLPIFMSMLNPTTCARYRVVEFPAGATWTPRKPARSIARCTIPEALASSINSLM